MSAGHPPRRRVATVTWLVGGGVLLVAAVLLSLFVGARAIGPGTTVEALVAFDGSRDHVIVRDLRLPR